MHDTAEIIRKLMLPVLQFPAFLEIKQTGEKASFFTAQVHPADMSRVVGSRGSNINALKELVRELGLRSGRAATLVLADPRAGLPRGGGQTVQQTRKWRPDVVKEPLSAFLSACKLPSEIEANDSSEGWRLALCGTIPKTVKDALNRWVAVMAFSTGGRAFVDVASTTVAV